jgi:aryl-alcohol dehydrogenase-like predicted oxidoreductase
MDYRRLGRTDLRVSAICLGTMTYGQQNTEAEGFAQMDYALEQGVNFFDTAELYSIPPRPETTGSTERVIGNWFKARKNRDKVILASKVVGRSGMTWFRDDGSPSRLTPAQMREAIDKNLARLQTDYIDLYQLHFPERPAPFGSIPNRFRPSEWTPAADETPIGEILETLDGFVKAGKVRHIGLSNESPWGTMRFLFESETRGLARVASVQNAYNLLNRSWETGMAEVSMREDVSLLAYSPLAQGFLAGKYLDGQKPPGARFTLFNRGQRYELPHTDDAIRDYIALAREFGLDPTQMANAYVTSRPFVTSNIIGATSMEQLRLAIASKDIAIAPELEARIDDIHQKRGNPAP